jgi:outer membrane protein OmpA-like peptidoglycan-associated protein
LILSQKRAEAVQRYLVQKGLDANRLDAKGYGQEKPVDDNSTPDGRAANRRVELKLSQQ